MKKSLFFLAIFYALQTNAQNYLISFAGTGGSTTVSSVKVENLTKGTSLILNGSDILNLSGVTGISEVENSKSSDLKIYPNPMSDKSTLEIFPPVAGDAIVSVYEITGKLVIQTKCHMENNAQSFTISGLRNGLYMVNVKGNTYQLSGKLMCNGKSNGIASIETTSNNLQTVKGKKSTVDTKGTHATVDMVYSSGDRLKFTATSGNYSTILTDIPATNKTITFNFIACSDGDGNNYPVVEIGTGTKGSQVWMAENLKTTKYNDGTTIPLVTDNTAWAALTTGAYCDYNNTPGNSTIYGRLYNWYVVDNNAATKVASNGGKNACPTSWHIPTDAEWTTLTTYLGGEAVAGGKLKETGTTHWLSPNPGATNETGFTALPGGFRYYNGTCIYVGYYGNWWSSTEYSTTSARFRDMDYANTNVGRYYDDEHNGLSVRCVRD